MPHSLIHHHGLVLNLRNNYAFKPNDLYSEIKRSDNYIFTLVNDAYVGNVYYNRNLFTKNGPLGDKTCREY
jgi:hypothetical protein